MRSALLFFYFFLQALLLIALPFFLVFYLLYLPFGFIAYSFRKSEEEVKEHLRLKFIGQHLLDQVNYKQVASWFEDYYQKHIHHTRWFSKANLFSIPPLARDWSEGFTPTLDQYGQDLTSQAYQNKTLNIVDREKEIDEIERTLSKSQEANVVIVGEEGVGKHTVVIALAKKMYEGKTKSMLMYKRIIWLNMEKILNQETDLKKRESFLEDLFAEAQKAKNILIFIDNLDRYLANDNAKIDLTSSIGKYAKSNSLQFIGITTPFYYEKYIFNNERLARSFVKIDVKEVTASEAEKILISLSFAFENRYGLILPYETIKTAIQKSDFYLTAIPFPEKAIDLLDSACVLAKSDQVHKTVVMPDLIDKVVSEKTHVPVTVNQNTKDKLIHLEELLLAKIVNQNEAIKKVASTLRRSFLLLGKRKKPLASFLFLGPTGVGKTETAKAIAKIFFGGEIYLLRFDMSNFQSTADIPKLIGSIDTGNPGLLAKGVRESPYGVLLLDEIEKGNRDLINIFLSVLDEGYFTDGFGKRVDCKNLVIIATSNAGSDFIYSNPGGSRISQMNSVSLIDHLIEQKIFSPEFLNRFDGVIAYRPLDLESAKLIAKKMLDVISQDIYSLHKVKISLSDSYINDLVAKGYDPKFGARNLERLLRDEVEDKIAKVILQGKLNQDQVITL